ncbi:hypothetical protein HY604_00560 [Candidatus Peregrinibacteria bacterium]|nr:hypothetical protein [Candidatus Peregrinibacteria bacterium]
MSLKATYEFLFFGRDENSFLENYSYDLFEEHGEKSGQLFINLEIQNNPADAEDIGQLIFETMQKVFFEDVLKDSYERFESALKAVNNVLKELKGQKVSGYIGNLNIVAAGIVGDILYLTKCGDSEAYLVRKRYVSVVSEGLGEDEDSGGDIFSSIANGTLQAGDMVIFSSARLLRYISKTDLAKAVNKENVMATLEEVKDVISTEMLGRVSLTGISFEEASMEDVMAFANDASDLDVKEESSLKSSVAEKTIAVKNRLTGKFLSVFDRFKRKKSAEVYSGPGKVVSFFRNFWNGLSNGSFGKSQILVLLIVVIVILLLGVWFVSSRQVARDEIAKLEGIIASISDKIAEAETKSTYDKDGAKTVLDQANIDAMTVLNSGYYRDKANLLLISINEMRDKLDNVMRVENPVVFADLSTKRSDVNALGFANIGDDRIFVYEYNALYELVLNQISDPITIDEEEIVIAATGFDDRKSVVFLTKSGKLLEYADGTIEFMDSDDGAFHKAVDIADWSNKIYLLDNAGNQIWKYTYKGTRGKFSSAEAYFAETLDLSGALSFAIDANVYLLNLSGEIMKFYSGKKSDFFINNPPFASLNDPKAIYTDEKQDYVYVLDGAEARVLVYGKNVKTGNLDYQKQYLFSGVGDLRDLYVNVKDKKLYVLSASRIFETAL